MNDHDFLIDTQIFFWVCPPLYDPSSMLSPRRPHTRSRPRSRPRTHIHRHPDGRRRSGSRRKRSRRRLRDTRSYRATGKRVVGESARNDARVIQEVYEPFIRKLDEFLQGLTATNNILGASVNFMEGIIRVTRTDGKKDKPLQGTSDPLGAILASFMWTLEPNPPQQTVKRKLHDVDVQFTLTITTKGGRRGAGTVLSKLAGWRHPSKEVELELELTGNDWHFKDKVLGSVATLRWEVPESDWGPFVNHMRWILQTGTPRTKKN